MYRHFHWSMTVKNSRQHHVPQTLVSATIAEHSLLRGRSSRQMSSVRELQLLAPSCGSEANCSLARPLLRLTPFWRPVTRRWDSTEAVVAGSGVSGHSWVITGIMLPLLAWGVWLWVWRYSSSMSLPSFHLFHFFSISLWTWRAKETVYWSIQSDITKKQNKSMVKNYIKCNINEHKESNVHAQHEGHIFSIKLADWHEKWLPTSWSQPKKTVHRAILTACDKQLTIKLYLVRIAK